MKKKYTLSLLETMEAGCFHETYTTEERKFFNKEKKDLFGKLGFNWVKPHPDKDEDEEQWDKDREVEYNKNPTHFIYNYYDRDYIRYAALCDKDHLQEDLIHISELEFAHEEIQNLAEVLIEEREYLKAIIKDLESKKDRIGYTINDIKKHIKDDSDRDYV